MHLLTKLFMITAAAALSACQPPAAPDAPDAPAATDAPAAPARGYARLPDPLHVLGGVVSIDEVRYYIERDSPLTSIVYNAKLIPVYVAYPLNEDNTPTLGYLDAVVNCAEKNIYVDEIDTVPLTENNYRVACSEKITLQYDDPRGIFTYYVEKALQ